MAEYVFKNMIEERGLGKYFYVTSRGTSDCEAGSPIYPPARSELLRHGIECVHTAKMLTRSELQSCDYALVMDSYNLRDVLSLAGGEFGHKVFKICSFTDNPRDVADPWYTRNFEKAYADIEDGCGAFLEYVIKEKGIG